MTAVVAVTLLKADLLQLYFIYRVSCALLIFVSDFAISLCVCGIFTRTCNQLDPTHWS